MGCGAAEEEAQNQQYAGLNEAKIEKIARKTPQKFDPQATGYNCFSPAIKFDFQDCIYCQACARACSDFYTQGIILRSTTNKIPYIGAEGQYLKLETTDCIHCGQCVLSCPNGCISVYPASRQLKSMSGAKYAIVSPSTQVKFKNYNLVEYLQRKGFYRTFSSATGVDLAVLYEARAIINARKQYRFVVSSMCPAFVEYVERKYPWLLGNLSDTKSPGQLLSAAIKTHLAQNASIAHFTPCAARKVEILRYDMIGECYCVVADSELYEMLLSDQTRQTTLRYSFSPPFDQCTRSAFAHEIPGSICEALARQIFNMYGDDFDLSKISVYVKQKWDDNDETIKVISFYTGSQYFAFGAACGGVAVKRAVEMLRSGELKVDYFEAFMCPLGCVNGGGSVVDFRFAEVCKRVDELKAFYREIAQESPYECYGVCEYLKYCPQQTQAYVRGRSFVYWY